MMNASTCWFQVKVIVIVFALLHVTRLLLNVTRLLAVFFSHEVMPLLPFPLYVYDLVFFVFLFF